MKAKQTAVLTAVLLGACSAGLDIMPCPQVPFGKVFTYCSGTALMACDYVDADGGFHETLQLKDCSPGVCSSPDGGIGSPACK